MTILSIHHIRVDGLTVATYAHGSEDIAGVDAVASPDVVGQKVAYQDGLTVGSGPWFAGAKDLLWNVWVSPVDANGDVTLTGGMADHLRANLEALTLRLGRTRNLIPIQYDAADQAGGVITLENHAYLARPVLPSGSHRTRRVPLTFRFPRPYWRDVTTGLVTAGPYTGAQTLTPAGTAPLNDATFTCTVAGRVTHNETGEYIEVTSIPGGASSVIVTTRPPRSVLDNLGNDVGSVFNPSHPWGLRFDAQTVANLTVTGTWQIDYWQQYV